MIKKLKRFFRRQSEKRSVAWLWTIGRFAWSVLTMPFRWLRSLISTVSPYVVEWYDRGTFRRLAFGLPALVTLLLSAGIGLMGYIQSGDAIYNRYRAMAWAEFDAEQWEAADIALQRVIMVRPEDNEVLFRLAQTSLKLEDYPKAAYLLNKLAPPDRPVNADAHFWRARQLLEQKNLTQDEVVELLDQLKHAISLRPGVDVYKSLLAQVFVQIGRISEAKEMLEQIRKRSPQDELQLAEIYLTSNDPDKARLHGDVAVKELQALLKNDVNAIQTRIDLARALVFVERFSEAVDVLQAAGPSNDDRTRSIISTVFATWSRSLGANSPLTESRFDLIANALKYDSKNILAYEQVLHFLEQSDGPELDQLRDLLREMLADGHEPALVHLCLGMDESFRGRDEQAMRHLELAHQLNPGMAVIANNFAWQIAFSPDGDLERALSLCEKALAQAPEYAEIRETRGQILLKLKRYSEAIADLESVVAQFRFNRQTRQALVTAYEAIGLPDLARQHASELEQLMKSPRP